MLRILAAIGLLLPTDVLAESYGECRARLVEAYQAGEFDLVETVAEQCLEIRPSYPGMLFNRALAQTLSGKPDSAMQSLAELADRNLAFDIAAEPFDQLAEHPRYEELLKRFEVLSASHGTASVAYKYHETDFVPEGIALDERDGSLYLGSIRNSKIVRLQANGEHAPFATAFQWSVFGMRIDTIRDELWVATAAVAQGKNTPAQELGETAILRFKLGDGSLLRRYRLPRHDQQEQVLGDLVLAESGIYTTDSLTGVVYKLNPVTGDYITLVPPGKLNSPQGLVESVDGNYLYVADYTGGLFRLRLADLDLQKVNEPANSVLYGIDGLYRYGNDLVAIQNGIRPHRVTRIQLNDSGDAITATEILVSGLLEFDEPTLGQVVGNDLLLVSNSHWNRFNASNELVDETSLAGPVILRVSLQ